jgi:protein-tyrosine kinase
MLQHLIQPQEICMSQLKKALEKARAERLELFSFERQLPGQPEEPVRGRDLEEPLSYTKTRVVEVSEELLLKNRIAVLDEKNPAADQFKLLRTHLFQDTRQRKLNAVQVAGFGPADGGSLIAMNLAVSIAKDNRQTTLLVDLNFRNPSLHRLLGLEADHLGLKSYFLDGVPLEELFISPGIKKLTVLLAGGNLANATELLGSPKMESLIRELKQRYDDRYVILDTPAINGSPDALVTSEYVDGIILVARAHHTAMKNIQVAMDRLPKAKILGVILNDVPQDEYHA